MALLEGKTPSERKKTTLKGSDEWQVKSDKLKKDTYLFAGLVLLAHHL